MARVAEQPTAVGRSITLSAVTADDKLTVGYGDEGNDGGNNGPIDVLLFDPDTGVTSVALSQADTERFDYYRTFADGSVWGASVDPRGSDPGFLVTNRGVVDGDEWRTIPVEIPALTVAVHLHDSFEVDGAIYVGGSRDILPSESSIRPDDEGAAVVWKSVDGGDTWTEDLVYFGNYASQYNRFWTFGRCGDAYVASTQNAPGAPQGYYVLRDGAWSARKTGITFPQVTRWQALHGDGFFVGTYPCSKYTLDEDDVLQAEPVSAGATSVVFVDGDRIVYNDSTTGRLMDSVHGELGRYMRSAAQTSDGTLYVTDGTGIYRVDLT